MTADEMLNELGFFKSEEESNIDYIVYINEFNEEEYEKIIFCIYCKSYVAYTEVREAVEIDLDLLKAIIAKEKELGWLD